MAKVLKDTVILLTNTIAVFVSILSRYHWGLDPSSLVSIIVSSSRSRSQVLWSYSRSWCRVLCSCTWDWSRLHRCHLHYISAVLNWTGSCWKCWSVYMLMWQRNDRLHNAGPAAAESQHSASASQAANDEQEDVSSSSSSTDVETAAKPSTKSRWHSSSTLLFGGICRDLFVLLLVLCCCLGDKTKAGKIEKWGVARWVNEGCLL